MEKLKQEIADKIIDWRNGKGPLLEDLISDIIDSVKKGSSCSPKLNLGSNPFLPNSNPSISLGPSLTELQYNGKVYHPIININYHQFKHNDELLLITSTESLHVFVDIYGPGELFLTDPVNFTTHRVTNADLYNCTYRLYRERHYNLTSNP